MSTELFAMVSGGPIQNKNCGCWRADNGTVPLDDDVIRQLKALMDRGMSRDAALALIRCKHELGDARG